MQSIDSVKTAFTPKIGIMCHKLIKLTLDRSQLYVTYMVENPHITKIVLKILQNFEKLNYDLLILHFGKFFQNLIQSQLKNSTK